MLKKLKIASQVGYGNSVKVPMVMQLEMLECGAACLTMIMAYYGRYITLETAREACGVSRDGQNAKNILLAARNYGMTAAGYKMEIEAFKQFNEFPCIIHWNFNHFVVMNGIKGGKVYINDPARGERTISMEEFDQSFSGVVLTFKPNEDFKQGGERRSVLSFVKKRLVGTGAAVLFMFLSTIIANMLGIINPIFTKVFLDRLLTNKSPEWMPGFFILISVIAVVSVIVAFVNTICSLKINERMAIMGSTTYMWKVLNLPMKFFSQRLAGDIQSREGTLAQISQTLVSQLTPLIINSFMMIFYLVVMIKYSVVLSIIGLSSIIINFWMSIIIAKKKMNIVRMGLGSTGKLSGTTSAAIEMIESVKATGFETGMFEKWAGYHALVNSNKIDLTKMEAYWGLIPHIINLIINDAILLLGIYFVFIGKFTPGSVMAFQGLLGSFSAPALAAINIGQSFITMRTNMERIEDVMEYPSDHVFAKEGEAEDDLELSGKIEIKDVSFGYSPLDNPLINNFNLELLPGKKVAFVGMTGCGKSTIAKLISGLYQPWSGEILFDGKPIGKIDKKIFNSSVAVVDQNIILFNDTIAENIRMWNKDIDDETVIKAAKDAMIYEDIMNRPDGFNSMLSENGKNLSGGQKQRIEIARALAQEPSVIVMDEATSALDAITELKVVDAISKRGITAIVIAHRLSTIRDCDEILVMNNGEVIERGTHEQLMANGNLYKELISSV